MVVTVYKDDTPCTHNADVVIDLPSEGSIMVQLKGDERKLSAVAEDFEDADRISVDDGREYAEPKEVIVLYRVDPDTVQVRIKI